MSFFDVDELSIFELRGFSNPPPIPQKSKINVLPIVLILDTTRFSNICKLQLQIILERI